MPQATWIAAAVLSLPRQTSRPKREKDAFCVLRFSEVTFNSLKEVIQVRQHT